VIKEVDKTEEVKVKWPRLKESHCPHCQHILKKRDYYEHQALHRYNILKHMRIHATKQGI
jgi:hypothetical protein